jgi:hypothetical protein
LLSRGQLEEFITKLGVEDGRMRPAGAATPVGAAVISTLVFPSVALALRGSANAADAESAPAPV